jgi:hypothetical protein
MLGYRTDTDYYLSKPSPMAERVREKLFSGFTNNKETGIN